MAEKLSLGNKLLVIDSLAFSLPSDLDDHHWMILGIGIEVDELLASKWLAKFPSYEIFVPKKASKKAQELTVDFMNTVVRGLPAYCEGAPGSKGKADPLDDPIFGNLWWFLEISELSPLRGNLVETLFRLSLIHETRKELKVDAMTLILTKSPMAKWISASLDKSLMNNKIRPLFTSFLFLKSLFLYLIQASRFSLSTLFIAAVFRRAGSYDPTTKVNKGIFTFFPKDLIVDANGKFWERFFPLINLSPQEEQVMVLSWASVNFFNVRQALKDFKAAYFEKNSIILQNFLCLSDLLNIFSIPRFLKLWQFSMAIGDSSIPKFCGVDLRWLLLVEVLNSTAKGEFFLDQLVSKSIRKASEDLALQALIFRFEGQPIDRALVQSVPKGCLTIGFWHSAICESANYIPLTLKSPVPKLMPASSKRWFSPPLPKRMLAANDICKENLRRIGFDERHIGVCGPLRQHNFFETQPQTGRKPDPLEKKIQKILPVALPISVAETHAIMAVVNSLLKKINIEQVVLKPHPSSPLQLGYLRSLLQKNATTTVTECNCSTDFMDHVANTKLLVASGSTIIFESLALGASPIVYEPMSTFPAISFEPFEKVVTIANTSQDVLDSLSCLNDDISETIEQATVLKKFLSSLYLLSGQYNHQIFFELVESFISNQKISNL